MAECLLVCLRVCLHLRLCLRRSVYAVACGLVINLVFMLLIFHLVPVNVRVRARACSRVCARSSGATTQPLLVEFGQTDSFVRDMQGSVVRRVISVRVWPGIVVMFLSRGNLKGTLATVAQGLSLYEGYGTASSSLVPPLSSSQPPTPVTAAAAAAAFMVGGCVSYPGWDVASDSSAHHLSSRLVGPASSIQDVWDMLRVKQAARPPVVMMPTWNVLSSSADSRSAVTMMLQASTDHRIWPSTQLK